MIHVKRIELTNFKSFGGTTSIPLLPGFTVVSGPNGSGKSNILDALLFALGLSSSKGMRADRLPDLVNNQQNRKGTIEASVTVTFDLSGFTPEEDEDEDLHHPEPDSTQEEDTPETDSPPPKPHKPKIDQSQSGEWSVTRKLRVTRQGTYTSTYYINDVPSTLTELHEQLSQLRIYPEGYNVVLQGDVTSIISMNAKERREIIDELAGVAQFDRKINLAKEKLDAVKDHEERSQIVEKELIAQRDRLASDRTKAEKYQKIRAELLEKSQLEVVLKYRHLQQKEWRLREQIESEERQGTELTQQLQLLEVEITQKSSQLEELNARVKALGESELIALQSTLATQEAEHRQGENRQKELQNQQQEIIDHFAKKEEQIRHYQAEILQLKQEKESTERQLFQLRLQRDEAQEKLDQGRKMADAIASTAEAWVQQQTELHRQIETLQTTLDPQRTEQAQLRERTQQLQQKIAEQTTTIQQLSQEQESQNIQLGQAQTQLTQITSQVNSLSQIVKNAEQELQIQQETQTRLLEEQRERQRTLDKLEAQAQALHETSGTAATQVIIQSGLTGICGLVCQLGRVEPRYQLALEIAAGNRLGNLVVEDDLVAAAAIELLKQKKGGRMTFLPLNKIKANRFHPPELLRHASGYINTAVHLIDCDQRYQNIFAYVFGNTVVFDVLANARPYLGQYRMVTLEGEILETSGAMTGGSVTHRSTLHFNTVDHQDSMESQKILSLQSRLQEIERILARCQRAIQEISSTLKTKSQELVEAKQNQRETQLKVEQLQLQMKQSQTQQQLLSTQVTKNHQELEQAQTRLSELEQELPLQEVKLTEYRQNLSQLESANSHSEWQKIQTQIRNLEAQLQERENAQRQQEQHLTDLQSQSQRAQEKLQENQHRLSTDHQKTESLKRQQMELTQTLLEMSTKIRQTQEAISQVEIRLGSEKQERDRAESHLRERHLVKQELQWQLEKLQNNQQERREELQNIQEQLVSQQSELPDPLPPLPEPADQINLGELQQEVKSLQKRLQALEPVNMLALEEYNRTQERLEELSQKLATLQEERTELLLRIENFTTLRRRAFGEAFNAVNENFQTIFAELSEGDGHLQLDYPEDPFNSGLNLVAHPKGKPVQRLASMSGGEKSLTALSFIFALQRYRPSTFYAFDEVDMFLDGSNVERLAKMIKRQAEQAQFIVVSLRRPMIESSERTIGVTQARGAYTQVLGLRL